jgi:hypothetical protein
MYGEKRGDDNGHARTLRSEGSGTPEWKDSGLNEYRTYPALSATIKNSTMQKNSTLVTITRRSKVRLQGFEPRTLSFEG